MVDLAERLHTTPEQVAEFCRHYHIRRLGVFGSVVRDDFAPQSDVDVLYEFEADFNPGLDILDIRRALSELLAAPWILFHTST